MAASATGPRASGSRGAGGLPGGGPGPLPGSGPDGTPRYLQLARALRSEIEGGRHPVGGLLPTEVEIARRNGVSRQTVRRAIGLLREEGLVSARKGVGTRVEARHAPERVTYSALSATDLVEIAADSEMTIDSSEWIIARGGLAAELGCRANRKWLHLTCTRRRESMAKPFASVSVYIDHRLASSFRFPGVLRTALFVLLEKHSGEKLLEIQQEIRATVLSAAMAARLDAAAGAPALEITRRFFGTGRRLMLVAINTLPSDRFFYSVAITRT
ncbi:Mannosyl-D-glycerate transport/metabolism system repressor MngR [Methylobacterium crusticola]|uniref:Mannosyl-D-glycerate transport/metabolism system repressor MngR n=1 Tax=Methylobacterium crusticola TaxID=1697972 RepID=A0ABQ4R7W2_9HYPH|nr:GntR family transcriptional regulator [Methylobacterium crusticola]GJD53244.1 Mannosyl-D-glycerate transport/metabolism system repressor MngR [Methylobacterium crusticola]